MLDLREKFRERPLVGDGAVGTLLGERGIPAPYNEANLTRPAVVRQIHEEYLRAGSGVVETDTFAVNWLRLAGLSNEYGLEVAQNSLVETESLFGGAYLMPPASMPHLTGYFIEALH